MRARNILPEDCFEPTIFASNTLHKFKEDVVKEGENENAKAHKLHNLIRYQCFCHLAEVPHASSVCPTLPPVCVLTAFCMSDAGTTSARQSERGCADPFCRLAFPACSPVHARCNRSLIRSIMCELHRFSGKWSCPSTQARKSAKKTCSSRTRSTLRMMARRLFFPRVSLPA